LDQEHDRDAVTLWGVVFGQCLPSSRVFRLTPVQPIQYKPPRKLVD